MGRFSCLCHWFLVSLSIENQLFMANFNDHKFHLSQLLDIIPQDFFAQIETIASNLKVDHYAKVLHGKTLFNLLLYGIIESDRLSLRNLEDVFNSPDFKILFQMDLTQKIRHSSLSERLSKVNVDFFREIYECLYASLPNYLSQQEISKYKFVSVDSTIVYEAAGKLIDGFKYNQSSKRATKTTVAFDGVFPCHMDLHTQSSYANESIALPETVLSYAQKGCEENVICLMDRGLSSALKMEQIDRADVDFIVRASVGRKYKELEEFDITGELSNNSDYEIIKDSRVHLYSQQELPTRSGKLRKCSVEGDSDFRLVVMQHKSDESKQLWFITNNFEITSAEICNYYKRRWDIEVFFRFVKQELNFSRLISLNKNGIEVMLYMTMITSMLLIIYKKLNNIGYKRAKFRFRIELREQLMIEIVKLCGGDPRLFFRRE